MKKSRTKIILGIALAMILGVGSLFSFISARATATYDVANYKGDRAQADWLVPEMEGKVFAGWYQDAAFKKVYTKTTGEAYPKFVDEKVLTVKKQLKADVNSTDGITDIRFLTAIDSLMLKNVTFDVAVPESNKEWAFTETTAYSSMLVEAGDSNTEKFPSDEDVFNTADAKYFVAHTLKNIPNSAFGHAFEVVPSWVTLDGTKVIGKTLKFTLNKEFLDGSLFAEKVEVGGQTVTSNIADWDVSQAKNNIVTGTHKTTNVFAMAPLYFKETGKTMLLQTTITNASATIKSEPMAGVYVTDGTNKGHFGLCGNGLVYGPWNEWVSERHAYAVLSQWGNKSVKLEVAYKDGNFALYVDEVFYMNLPLSKVLSSANASTELAYGLTMRSANAEYPCVMKFSEVQFTTDADKVAEFLNTDIALETYGTGKGKDLQYNNVLYGMNGGDDVEGADPGVFYVSKEQDSKWGGYYYMYVTGSTIDDYALYDGVDGYNAYAFRCYRSKDLYKWELCGSLSQGYSLQVDWSDWARDAFWAPEVIQNPKDGKYYMYFSAASRPEWGTATNGLSSSTLWSDRLYLGVAVADTPVGPFDMLYDTADKRIPTINFRTGCNTTYDWSAIDASPFFDDDGTLYLYFNKHTDSHYDSMKGVWGVKMLSMTTPDYSTVSYLAKANKTTVANTPGQIESSTSEGATYEWKEGGINEAPFMMKHNGKYYLTYASNGFGAYNYSVHQAVSTSPLSGFTKLTSAQGNPVLNGSAHGGSTHNYMNGTAHHSVVKKGDEMWIVYHRHNSTKGVDEGMDRSICADRVQFVKNSENIDVLTANGPSMSLQWLPESVSGYKNLAKTASITISTGSGKEYLTDELLPFYSVVADRVMSASGDVTVTLKWNEPVKVSSLMIYNAYSKDKAFSKVQDIRFKLTGNLSRKYNVISELEFPAEYMSNSTGAYVPCAPAVAEFAEITTTELQFTIPASKAIQISEIVVLGGGPNPEKSVMVYDSFCGAEHDSNIQIDGQANEDVWTDKVVKTYYGLSNGQETGLKLEAKSFKTDKGVYIAVTTNDTNIKNDGQHTMLENSAFTFSVLADNVGATTPKEMWKAYEFMIDMRGDCHSYVATSLKRAVKYDTQGASAEIFIPWAELGIDTTKGIPSEFKLYPGYRAVLKNATESVELEWISDLMFADKLTVNGKEVASGIANWTYSGAEKKAIGTHATNSVFYMEPLYFRSTGQTMVFQSTITNISNPLKDQPLAGLYVTDGTNKGGFGVYSNVVKYGQWLDKNAATLPYAVLTQWDTNTSIDFDVVLKNGEFYIYVQGIYVTKIAVNAVMFSGTSSGDLAFGLTMRSEKGVSTSIEFSNIEFSTDAAKVDEFMNPADPMFGRVLTVNGKEVTSGIENWIYNGTSKTATGTHTTNSVFYMAPLYFKQTGTTMLFQSTITNVSNPIKDQPLAGLYVTDGTNKGGFGLFANTIKYGQWLDKQAATLSYAVLSQWDTHPSVKLEVALKNGEFHIYVDGVFVTKLAVNSVMFSGASSGDLAFGLTMRSEKGVATALQFSDINFTTDAATVDAFLEPADPMFAKSLTVNNKEVTSGISNWTYNGTAKTATGTHTTNSVFYMDPLYFKETGSAMLFQSTITNISNPIKDQPLAGMYITDGTNKGGFGVYSNLIKYGQWLDKNGPSLGYAVLTQWDTNPSIQFDVALKNGELYIYVNQVFITKLKVNDIMFSGTSSGDLAFGLTMRSEKGVATVLQFSNINFTTDATAVDAFLAPPAAAELFADSLTVNSKALTSNTTDWTYNSTEKTATGTHTSTSVFAMAPVYFKETGNTMLLSTTISNDSETIKSEPMAGIYVTDGTNKGHFGLCGNGLVYGPWNEWVSNRHAYAVLSQWGNKTVKLDVAYKDGNFALYVDNVFFMNLPLSTVLPSASASTELAFGLTMRSANAGFPCVMKFGNVSFTTDTNKVNAFLTEKESSQ